MALLQPLSGYNPAQLEPDFSFIERMGNTIGQAVKDYPWEKLKEERYKVGTELAKENVQTQKLSNKRLGTEVGKYVEDVETMGKSGANWIDVQRTLTEMFDDAKKTIVKTVNDERKKGMLLGKLQAMEDLYTDLYPQEYPLETEERTKWLEKAKRDINALMPTYREPMKYISEKKYTGLNFGRPKQQQEQEVVTKYLNMVKDYDKQIKDTKDKYQRNISSLRKQLSEVPEGTEMYMKIVEQMDNAKKEYESAVSLLKQGKAGVLEDLKRVSPEAYQNYVQGYKRQYGTEANKRIVSKLGTSNKTSKSNAMPAEELVSKFKSGQITLKPGMMVNVNGKSYKLLKFRTKDGRVIIGYKDENGTPYKLLEL